MNWIRILPESPAEPPGPLHAERDNYTACGDWSRSAPTGDGHDVWFGGRDIYLQSRRVPDVHPDERLCAGCVIRLLASI